MPGMRYQPQGIPRLNTAHPLARGLAGFWIPNGSGFRSVVAGVPDATMTAAGRFVAQPKGLAIATAGGVSAVIANSARVKPPATITALVDGFMPTSGYPLGCENSNDGWGIYSASGFMRPYLRVGAAWADRASNIAPGASGQVGFTYDGATFWSVTNGKRHFDQAITGSITNSSVGIAINAMNPSGASAGNGMLYYFALWNRALSPDELASFHANPWQLFADPEDGDDLFGGTAPTNVDGSFSGTLSGVGLSSSGAIVNAGGFAAALAGVTMSASGLASAAPTGSFSTALSGVSFSATGALRATGSVASSLAGTQMLAGGNVAAPASGAIAASLDGASMSAYGYPGDAPMQAPSRRYRPRILRRHFTN